MTNEDAILDRIRRGLERASPRHARRETRRLVLGIGDDAAIVRSDSGADWVLSADFSIEGIHFLTDTHPPEAVGYRALARAASDLAAMGACPDFFLLSLALPAMQTGRWLTRMLSGMSRAANRLRMRLVGGDTTRYLATIIAITVVGRIARGRAIRRDGARPGDLIYVSGRLGEAALGLSVLLGHRDAISRYRRLLQPHFYPSIPIQLGIHLASRRLASAMIDLSDGLSTDLARLARSSRVGARIRIDTLPSVFVPAPLQRSGVDRLKLALHGGDDYGLLFTVPRDRVGRVPKSFRGVPLTCIGEITRSRRIHLIDAGGRSRPLPDRGWDPFRPREASGFAVQILRPNSARVSGVRRKTV